MRPEALAALEQVIRLANATQIPLASSVFGIAFELIRCINGMRCNKEMCVVLLQSIANHARRIDDFMRLMPVGFLDDPHDPGARVVREGLERFRMVLEGIQPIIVRHATERSISRYFFQEAMRGDLLNCNMQLVAAREAFNDTIRDVNLALSLNHRPVRHAKDGQGCWTGFTIKSSCCHS